LFKSNLNEEARQALLLTDGKWNTVKDLVKFLSKLNKIPTSSLLTERDRLRQKAGETPYDFVIRWNLFGRKAQVLHIDLGQKSAELFASKLLKGELLRVTLNSLNDMILLKICQQADAMEQLGGRITSSKARTADKKRPTARPEKPSATSIVGTKPKPEEPKDKSFGGSCFNCGRRGHRAKDCLDPPRDKEKYNRAQVKRYQSGRFQNQKVQVALDRCADVSVVDEKQVDSLCLKPVQDILISPRVTQALLEKLCMKMC
jgi:hypothetical protein